MQTQRVGSDTQIVWVIDPSYSTLEFSVKKLFFFIVKGCFAEIAGTLVFEKGNISGSSVEAVIKAGSINTGSSRRDAHLRSADFLNVDRYPEIRFESTKVEPGLDRDTLRITGSLTIREKTRQVVLDVNELDHSRSPSGEEVIYYSATTELDRFDFGINYGRPFIGRKVKIVITVQALGRK